MLLSQLFAGDQVLQDVADDLDRISRTQHTPSESVRKVQTALLQWRPDSLPQFGADSKYGNETAEAVVAFKRDELGVPPAEIIDDVGPLTVIRLDEIMVDAERPPEPVGTRVRQDVWLLQPDLGTWHPIMEAYARAVGQLKLENSPILAWSWSYQRDIHGTGSGQDPDFVNQCQHACSFFLPWHRMYLAVFERILIDVIDTIDEIPDEIKATWALPYWDYDRDDTRTLPPAFREDFLSDGVTENPLREEDRGPDVNAGDVALVPFQTGAQVWFRSSPFRALQGPSFGGAAIGRHHDFGLTQGTLENQPHNSIHNFVGGMMNDPNQAAFDPVFWVHHANIDRLWEIWRFNTGAGQDPTEDDWVQEAWRFRTTMGEDSLTPSGVMQTVADLNYEYADVSVPASAPALVRRRRGVDDERIAAARPLQRVGGIEAPMTLADAAPQQLQITVEDVEGLVAAIGAPTRLVLTLEHIEVTGRDSPDYGIFVEPTGGAGDDAVLVGVMSLFGIVGDAEQDGEHEYNFAFDLEPAVEQLSAIDQWDPTTVTLSFRPLNDRWIATQRGANALADITIGSISISVQ